MGEVADLGLSWFSLEENAGRAELVCVCVFGECPFTLRNLLEMGESDDTMGLCRRNIDTERGPYRCIFVNTLLNS